MYCGSDFGIIEFMRDVLGWPISIGTVHNVLLAAGGWKKTQVGGVDWVKDVVLKAGNQVAVAALGVEVQVSARSIMLYRDVSHLRESLRNAEIDVGVIAVPDDDLAYYLTDRTPSLKEAIETIRDVKRLISVPIITRGGSLAWRAPKGGS